MRDWIGRGAGWITVLALAGCSSIPLDTTGRTRGLDYLNDDVASMLVAFDLPQALEPLREGSRLKIDVTSATSGERHVVAVLTETDPGDLAGTLPPPADGRTYYLFGFSEADKAAIRDLQGFARGLPAGVGSLSVAFMPQVCQTEEIDVRSPRVSVLVALPGTGGVSPLIANQPLAAVVAGADVPPCAGHSG